jgi:teichuronic acid biosynthesis glycosyltransferase TuaG
MSPTVSIITPAYRAAGFIDETIRSVVAQDFGDWELLVADDASPDQTREIVSRWSEQDSRITLIPLPKNGGPATARNAAIARASGRWLAFLDSDDSWAPEKLSRSLAFAEREHAAFVFTGFRRVKGEAVGTYVRVPSRLTYAQLLGNTAIATSTVLLDRAQIGEIRMKNVYYDDLACWLGVLRQGFLAHGLNEDLMRYRVHEESYSRKKLHGAREVWRMYRSVERLSLLRAAHAFSGYVLRASLKHRRL